MLVSAVVCTRNRSAMTVRAVQSLVDQTADPSDYEILVVDNGSTDDTQERMRELAETTERVALRYVQEPRTGIAHARNTGYKEARGEYIAFIDDDAAAEPDWLERVINNIRGAEAPLVALGGQILPLYEAPKPSWFLDEYEIRTWGGERRFLEPGESFSASNMVVQRQAFVDVGGFPTDVGMSGERLMIGEEPQVFLRFWEELSCERRILYDPGMQVLHSVPAHKMRLLTRAGRRFVSGQFAGHVILRTGRGRLAAIARALVSFLFRSLAWVFFIFKTWNLRRWIFEGFGYVAEPLGRLLLLMGIEPELKRY